MKPKDALGEKAAEYFDDGYNCAQSVLLAMAERWKCRSRMIPKIATAFGAGIGRCGSTCGALAGGVMAIGMKYGVNEPSPKKRTRSYELAQKLYKQFELQHGSTACRELIKYDLSNPDEREKAREEKIFEKKCSQFIRTVVDTLTDLIEHSP